VPGRIDNYQNNSKHKLEFGSRLFRTLLLEYRKNITQNAKEKIELKPFTMIIGCEQCEELDIFKKGIKSKLKTKGNEPNRE
jgi:hypothetical protein